MKSGAVFAYLAVGCIFLGILMTYVTIFICAYYGIDVSKNLWIMAIPLVVAVALNIFFIELHDRLRKK